MFVMLRNATIMTTSGKSPSDTYMYSYAEMAPQQQSWASLTAFDYNTYYDCNLGL